ncbi:hypothetical protein [Candidatus Frankia alpina]|nr:hypothetical protein [Candidatus Frankia alpina]
MITSRGLEHLLTHPVAARHRLDDVPAANRAALADPDHLHDPDVVFLDA